MFACVPLGWCTWNPKDLVLIGKKTLFWGGWTPNKNRGTKTTGSRVVTSRPASHPPIWASRRSNNNSLKRLLRGKAISGLANHPTFMALIPNTPASSRANRKCEELCYKKNSELSVFFCWRFHGVQSSWYDCLGCFWCFHGLQLNIDPNPGSLLYTQ